MKFAEIKKKVMEQNNRKYIIAGVIGLITLSGALAYIQYKKIMDYVIKVKGIKIRALSPTLINFDLLINLTNKANIGYTILNQKYKVFINNVEVSDLVSNYTAKVPAKGNVDMPVNVTIDPVKVVKIVKTSYKDMLLKPETIKVKIEYDLIVRLFGVFKTSIKSTYETTLKDIVAPKPVE
jgi:LEA14-like dessication related protein